jgi:hypothetical protein
MLPKAFEAQAQELGLPQEIFLKFSCVINTAESVSNMNISANLELYAKPL